MKQLLITLIVSLIGLANCYAQQNPKNQENSLLLQGKTITWTWTQGAFKGAQYQVQLLPNNQIHWKGLKGDEKGMEATEEKFHLSEIDENIYTLSWHESAGWTVTVTVNLSKNTTHGIVSNGKEWYPISGVVNSIK